MQLDFTRLNEISQRITPQDFEDTIEAEKTPLEEKNTEDWGNLSIEEIKRLTAENIEQ